MRCTKTMVIVALFFMLVYWGIRHSTAEASDYYLGEYPNGQIAYLDTGSIRDYEVTKNGYWVCDKYECYVKAVYQGTDEFERIPYEITYSEGIIEYMVSKEGTNLYNRHTMSEFLQSHPVERNLIDYFRSFRKRQGK